MPGDGGDHRDARPPGAAPGAARCWPASARTRSCCPSGARASPSTCAAPAATREGGAYERPRHRRRRLHRLGLRPPPARDPPRASRCGCSTSSPTRAGARTCEDLDESRLDLVVADIADAEAVRAALDGCDAIVNFAAETHVDRSIEAPGRVHPDRRLRHLRPARGRPRARASGTCRSRPTRSTARSTRARSPRARRSIPPRPYSASKAGGDMMVGAYQQHLRLRGADRPRLEQLRPAPVPREADPALHPQRARRRAAAGLRRRHAGPQLALGRRTSPARSTSCSSSASRARSTTSAAPTSSPNIEVVQADPRAHRARRVADLSTSPTASATTAATRSPRRRPRALGWKARGRLRRGDRADGRVVSRERVVVEADPLGRVPRVLRAPVRLRARLMPERLETRLDGLVLLEPAGARRRARLPGRDLQRATPGRELGVDGEFVQDNHSRSGAGILRGLHFQTEPGPGEAGPLPARADLGRRRRPAARLADLRPMGGLRARRRAPPPALRPGGLRARLLRALRRSPTSTTSSRATTTRRPRPGSPGTTPTVGVEWPLADPQVSERDANAPRLAEIADELPF